MAERNEERKQYTFMNMKRCIGKNNNQYIGVTVECLVHEPSALNTTNSGKKVINFKTPISNRGKYIESMCGKAPYANDSGTTWAKVSLWEDGATRFQNFAAKHPACVIMVTGAIKVSESTDDNGRTYVNLDITADDFSFVRDITKKENGNAASNNAATAAKSSSKTAQQPATQNSAPAFGSMFHDYDEDDGELPF